MSYRIKVGDNIEIKDYSYSLLVEGKTLMSTLDGRSGHTGWVVVATDCVLPTGGTFQDHFENDTVIMDDYGTVAFICSTFINKVPEKSYL